jgi:photosystem II stability/assembly factor-like uncharacterized protein
MKRLIFLELTLILLATTFETDSPPGWFQQNIALGNKLITDIQFIDTSNGWVITDWGPSFDSGYVFRTTNSGNNWEFQYRYPASFKAIQMMDINIGYMVGSTGLGRVWKTINGGLNWNIVSTFFATPMTDLHFVNESTGWVSTDDNLSGGLFKTTNGGLNWQTQLDASFRPARVFFIGNDTGWVGTNEANGRLFRTTNSGTNWNLIFTFSTNPVSFYFINGKCGWIGGAGTGNGIQYTTNGGFNWNNSQGYSGGGYDIEFVNDSIGYSGRAPEVLKSEDGGKNWGYQIMPPNTYRSIATIRNDSLHVWAGTYSIIHTFDGGGPINYTGINQISSEIPLGFKLLQNYLNPFNPKTIIRFQISKSTKVSIKVYDINGKEISELFNKELNPGIYETDFDGRNISSGIYFYSLIIEGRLIETKKMLLVK